MDRNRDGTVAVSVAVRHHPGTALTAPAERHERRDLSGRAGPTRQPAMLFVSVPAKSEIDETREQNSDSLTGLTARIGRARQISRSGVGRVGAAGLQNAPGCVSLLRLKRVGTRQCIGPNQRWGTCTWCTHSHRGWRQRCAIGVACWPTCGDGAPRTPSPVFTTPGCVCKHTAAV